MSDFLTSLLVRNNVQESLKKSTEILFTHGSNVIMVNGNYKGYYAFLKEYIIPKYEVTLKEENYVSTRTYGGNQLINNEIITPYGTAVITDKIPELIVIASESEELALPTNYYITLVQYKENNDIKLGVKINSIYEIADEVENIGNMTIQDFVEQLKSTGYKKVPGTLIKLQPKQILDKKMVVVEPGKFLGRTGIYLRGIEEQYKIQYYKKVLINKKWVTRMSGNQVKITRGIFRDKIGVITNKIPARLVLFINALNQEIHQHYVYENERYVNRPIFPDDVFYMDVVLLNGNQAEVKEIYDNDSLKIIEKMDKMYQEKIINMNEIKQYNPGFSLRRVQDEETLEEVDDMDLTGYTPVDTEIKENIGDDVEDEANQEFQTDEPEQETQQQEEVTMQATFGDLERTQFLAEDLSAADKSIKNDITKVATLYQFSLTVNEEYELLDSVRSIRTSLNNEKSKINIKETNPADIKYIIAIVVLHYGVRHGYTNMNVEDKTSRLYQNKYLTQKDIINTIWLNERISGKFSKDEIQELKVFKQRRNYIAIIKIMMQRCNNKIQTYTGQLYENQETNPIELIPIGRKEQDKINPEYYTKEYKTVTKSGKPLISKKIGVYYPEKSEKVFLNLSNVLNNELPKEEKTILWGTFYQPIVDFYINYLKENKKSASLQEAEIYTWIIDNLPRAPYALKEPNQTSLDDIKKRELKFIYDQMLKEILNKKQLVDAYQREKQQEKSDRESQHQLVEEKRDVLAKRRREDENFESEIEQKLSKLKL